MCYRHGRGMEYSDWPGLGHLPTCETRGWDQHTCTPGYGLSMREGLVPKGKWVLLQEQGAEMGQAVARDIPVPAHPREAPRGLEFL